MALISSSTVILASKVNYPNFVTLTQMDFDVFLEHLEFGWVLVRNYGDAGGDAGRWGNKKTRYQRFHDLARDAAHRKNGGAAPQPQVRTPEAIEMEGDGLRGPECAAVLTVHR